MIISIDVGNGYVKAVNETGNTLHFPTALKEKQKDDIVMSKKSEYIIKIDDSEFYMGDLALIKGADRVWKAGKEFNQNTYYFIALCSHLLSNKDKEVDICLGLPFSYFISLEKGKSIIEELEGKIIKTVYKETKKTIKINKVSVYCQGIGAYMANLFDENGNLRSNANSLIKSLVIDIGFRTVDVVAFDKINSEFELKTGFSLEDTGISYSLNNIIRSLQREGEFNTNEIEYAIKNNNSKLANAFGEIDLAEYENKAYSELAEKIIAETTSKLSGEINKYNNIFITGGGAAKLEEYIKKVFKQVQLQNDPIFANARGYIILEKLN